MTFRTIRLPVVFSRLGLCHAKRSDTGLKMPIAKLWAFFVLLMGLPVAAMADICGAPRDIALGNGYSDLVFAAYALDPVDAPPVQAEPDYAIVRASGRDDTDRLQAALDTYRRVQLVEGQVYAISRQLVLGSDTHLVGGGEGATILMRNSAGSDFANQIQSRSEIFDSNIEGLRLSGQDISLRNLFIVKEYRDNTYGVAVNVRAASRVTLDRLRIRGFALAPGIISVQSAHDVVISNSIIHASCSHSKNAPNGINGGDYGAFQITGIVVDDMRPQGSSSGVTIRNNVIRDLNMDAKGNPRGDQTDGINIHQTLNATAPGLIENNHIANVAEGIDLFGHNIVVRNNRVEGSQLAIKLIHGARQVHIVGNIFGGQPSIAAIAAYSSREDTDRQVQDVWIIENEFDLAQSSVPAVLIDRDPTFTPQRLSIIGNRFSVPQCAQIAVNCGEGQCWELNNVKRDGAGQGC